MSAAAAQDAPFDARYHMQEILSYIQSWKGRSNVQFLDLFSGVAEASRVFSRKGYVTRNFDINMGDDITRRDGFFKCLEIVMSLVLGGLILLGPPCSLWVFMSASVHRRTKCNTEGDCTKEAVRSANLLVRNICFLIALAHFRGIFVILEQPSSSQMKNYSWLCQLCSTLRLRRITTWMGCYGHLIPKPSYLLSNLANATQLRKIWSKKRELQKKVTWL